MNGYGEVHGAPFVDAMLGSPVGVSLLAALEAAQRRDVAPFTSPPDVDPRALENAVIAVRDASFGDLCAAALRAASDLAGPWNPSAASRALTGAYRFAVDRRALAAAIGEIFGQQMHAALDRTAQERWLDTDPASDRPHFGDLAHVYGNGEFTFEGLWTVTNPPVESHDDLIFAWEYRGGPVSRWTLPVGASAARFFEIHRPADWVRLVEAYPKPAASSHAGWELPGWNQPVAEVTNSSASPPARRRGRRFAVHLLPDWSAVAADYDGVHLSWAGFVTTEGYVSDVAPDGVTMLRYWGSERTLWLRDVFSVPLPLGAPRLSGAVNEIRGINVSRDTAQRRRDERVIATELRRDPV